MRLFRLRGNAFIIILLIGIFLLSGCNIELFDGRTSRTESFSSTIALGEAKSIETKIDMGVGELLLTGGCDDLFSGEFLYNIPEWKPEVDYKDSSEKGKLLIKQPSSMKANVNKTVYEWILAINSDISTSLDLDLGVGSYKLDLRGINLTGLEIDCGVGELELDLSGHWDTGFKGSIDSGIGEVTIYLPKDIGVKVDISSGIGSINTKDLTKKTGSYYNAAAETSPILIELDIEGGIGEINIELR